MLKISRHNSVVLWGVVGNLGKIISQAIYFILIARLLGSAQYGIFASVFAFVNLFVPFTAFGSGNLIVLNISTGKGAFREYFGSSIALIILFGFLLSIFCCLSSRVLYTHVDYRLFVLMCISELVLFRFVDISAQAFQAYDRMKISSNIYLFSSLFRLIIALLFTITQNHILLFWMIGYLASNAIVGLVSVSYTAKVLGWPIVNLDTVKYFLRCGWPYSLGISSTSVYTDIDKVLLGRSSDLLTVGAYNASYRLILIGIAPLQAIVYSLNTRMFRLGLNGVNDFFPLIKKFCTIIFGFTILSYIAFYFLSGIIEKILGNGYGLSKEILFFMLPLIPLASINFLLGDILMGLGRQNLRSLAQLGIAIISFLIGLVAIPAFGWIGGIATALSSQVFLLLILFSLLYKEYRMGNHAYR